MLLLILGSNVSASNTVSLHEFKGNIYWDGNRIDNNTKTPFLQSNGAVYVPIRLLENTNAGVVSYESKTNSIYYDSFDTLSSHVRSITHNQNKDDLFQLRINSSKEKYNAGEELQIWASLDVIGDEDVKVLHLNPLVIFYIKDSNGVTITEPTTLNMQSDLFKPGDQIIRTWNGMLANNYLSAEIGDEKNTNARPLRLPKGEYTIGAELNYSISDDSQLENNAEQYRLETNIPIKIE
ncbi:hypothetical protein [Paenibacillus marinisediminis]